MTNNFNFIAPFYDRLARLVFGTSLLVSQSYFLTEIEESDKVLILGGGTGKLLEELPKCQVIYFVDLSQKMIDRAKKRDSKSPTNFIQADFLEHNFDSDYDVIICPFFLDCFDEVNLDKVIFRIKSILKSSGKLIVTDFQKTKNNLFLLKTMHLFFRISASLEPKEIKKIHSRVLLEGFKECKEKFFYRNMIFSRLYGNL